MESKNGVKVSRELFVQYISSQGIEDADEIVDSVRDGEVRELNMNPIIKQIFEKKGVKVVTPNDKMESELSILTSGSQFTKVPSEPVIIQVSDESLTYDPVNVYLINEMIFNGTVYKVCTVDIYTQKGGDLILSFDTIVDLDELKKHTDINEIIVLGLPTQANKWIISSMFGVCHQYYFITPTHHGSVDITKCEVSQLYRISKDIKSMVCRKLIGIGLQ